MMKKVMKELWTLAMVSMLCPTVAFAQEESKEPASTEKNKPNEKFQNKIIEYIN